MSREHQQRQPALSRSVRLTGTNKVDLLSADDVCFGWGDGIPTLHVAATPAGNYNASPNTKGQLHVAWSNERGGGEAYLDLGMGQAFTVGAAYTSLTVDAQFVPIAGDLAPGTPLVIPCEMIVSMSVGGQGTLSSKPPLFSSPSYALNAESTTQSPRLQIPPFAKRARVFSNVQLGLAAFPSTALALFQSDTLTTYEPGFGNWVEVGQNTHYQITNSSSSSGRWFVLWELSL